jgi:hypothetical protein
MTITVDKIAGLPTSYGGYGVAAANPYMAGLQVLSGLFGGSKVDISKAGASGSAFSGEADFFGSNRVNLKNKMVDLKSPQSVLILAVGLVGSIYIYKKYIR